MKSIIAGLGLFALASAQRNTYVANFTGVNDITGTVTIDNGRVIVDLNVSSDAMLPDGFDTCVTGGLKYHIHKKWNLTDHTDDTDRVGSGCGAMYTGGHWDPWHGCGSASGNEYCSNNNATSGHGCIPTSDYSADLDSDVFSAEVGDWNGKYGLITVNTTTGKAFANESSFYEVTPDDIYVLNVSGYAGSVVFHCNGGSRAFCAPFINSSTATSYSIPDQADQKNTTVFAELYDLDSYATFYDNGSVMFEWDPTYLMKETECTDFKYGIFESNSTWDSSGFMLQGSDCDDYVGDFYDPTHQCMDFSGSDYCTGDNGELCNDVDGNYSYACDWDTNRYSCAPGDLSGKMGTVNYSQSAYLTLDSTSLIPRVDDLNGMMFVVYCGNNSEGISYGACAPIVSSEDEVITTLTPSDPTMVATFYGYNGIFGTVTVDNGYIKVDLDLSDQPNLPGGYAACVDGGLKYHIHTKWEHNATVDRINGTDCGSTYTGGHYDPWHGCGSASGNAYCSGQGGCIDATDYSADYDNDVFSAEVGDWNGKYGLATVDDDYTITMEDSSFWEVMPNDIANMSIVFHCNDGTRAFCSAFVESGTETSETIPDQDADYSTVVANFSSADGYTDDSAVYMNDGGDVNITLDGSEITDDTGCSEWSYGIFEAGESSMGGSAFVGEDCKSYVGDFWDPTHQCMDFSGSQYCWHSDYLCNDTDYSYLCDYDDDRYSCAPGDLSGKFGKMDDYEYSLSEEGPNTLIPKIDDMVGLVFVIYCGDNDDGIGYLSCAPILEYDDDDGDDAAAQTVAVSVVAMVLAMMF